MKELVLVTGGAGFVASHCIVQLLDAGYSVRTTLRSLRRVQEVLDMAKKGGAGSLENLSFIEADLTDDKNWSEAVKDCTYVLHVATPIFLEIPKHEDEVIRPAVDGTIRVLKAAKKAEVKRVVLTSSFAAIGYRHLASNGTFTEEDWTDPNDKHLSTYVRSKVLAEKAAWDFMAREGGNMELTVINPMAIWGPLLGPGLSSGHQLLKQLLDGKLKACPKIDFGMVDVRDVADLHVRAMTSPNAAGQRFLALAGGVMSFHEIAMFYKKNLGNDGRLITEKVIPDWLMRFAALFSAKARQVVPMLAQNKKASNEKAKTLLDWQPRSNEEALLAAAKSIIQLGNSQ